MTGRRPEVVHVMKGRGDDARPEVDGGPDDGFHSMTQATLFRQALSPASAPAPRARRRGRRPTSSIQRERDRHVLAAVMLYVRRIDGTIVASALGRSRSTVYEWARKALDYPEYAAEVANAS